MESVLGFSKDFIAQHYLINQTLACLQADLMREPQEIAFVSYPLLQEHETNSAAE